MLVSSDDSSTEEYSVSQTTNETDEVSDNDQLDSQIFQNQNGKDDIVIIQYSGLDRFFYSGNTFIYVFLALVALIFVIFVISATVVDQHSSAAAADDDDDETVNNEIVLLVSIDALRWKYIMNTDDFSLPNIRALASHGVSASMKPIFPSKTFPNHYSIVTGLYGESHGIVGNSFWDPVFEESFDMVATADQARWWGGEPIWVSAEKEGIPTACYLWPGCEAPIGGNHSTYWSHFDDGIPNYQRVDRVLNWLSLSSKLCSRHEDEDHLCTRHGGEEHHEHPTAPRFITLYFSDVDTNGHKYGPHDIEMIQLALSNVDDAIGQLFAGIDRLGLSDRVNLILVSDHGMTEVSPDRVITLSNLLTSQQIDQANWSGFGVMTNVWPNTSNTPNSTPQQIIDSLYNALHGKHSHLSVYKKQDIPERYHYTHNRRIPPLLLVADPGWMIAFDSTNTITHVGGTHGYDNDDPDMQASFIAHGPSLAAGGTQLPSFDNVQLYNLMATLLNLHHFAPNNGTLSSIQPFLRDDND